MTFSWLSKTFHSQAPNGHTKTESAEPSVSRDAQLSTLRGFCSKAAKLSFRLKPA